MNGEPHVQEASLDLRALRDAYLKAQLAGNRREALRLVFERGLDRGATLCQLQLDVVQSAQQEIGRLWQENRISIAQEHMATAISQYVLAHLYQRAHPEPEGLADELRVQGWASDASGALRAVEKAVEGRK